MKPMTPITLLFAAALLAGAAARASAATDYSAALNHLDSNDFQVREAATERLLADDDLTFDEVRRLYNQATTLEQRQRLLLVARHHSLREVAAVFAERAARDPDLQDARAGALGVQTDAVTAEELPELNRPAIRVSHRLAGFPAFAVLKRDDLIIAVNGVTLSQEADHRDADGPFVIPAPDPPTIGTRTDIIAANFRELVKGHKTGQSIHLTVVRDGRNIQVAVTLGSLYALDKMYSPVIYNSVFDPRQGVQRVNVQFGLTAGPQTHWDSERRRLLGGDRDTGKAEVGIDWFGPMK